MSIGRAKMPSFVLTKKDGKLKWTARITVSFAMKSSDI